MATVLGVFGALFSAGIGANIAVFPPAVTEGRLTLERVGYGEFRFAHLFDVYAAALYLPSAARTALPPHPRTPKRLDLYYLRDVPRERIIKAAKTVLQRQYDSERYAALQADLSRWHENVLDAARGDRFSMAFDGRSLTLRHNGKLIAQSKNQSLAEAYFGIWLGQPSIDETLRSKLLSAAQSVSSKP